MSGMKRRSTQALVLQGECLSGMINSYIKRGRVPVPTSMSHTFAEREPSRDFPSRIPSPMFCAGNREDMSRESFLHNPSTIMTKSLNPLRSIRPSRRNIIVPSKRDAEKNVRSRRRLPSKCSVSGSRVSVQLWVVVGEIAEKLEIEFTSRFARRNVVSDPLDCPGSVSFRVLSPMLDVGSLPAISSFVASGKKPNHRAGCT